MILQPNNLGMAACIGSSMYITYLSVWTRSQVMGVDLLGSPL